MYIQCIKGDVGKQAVLCVTGKLGIMSQTKERHKCGLMYNGGSMAALHIEGPGFKSQWNHILNSPYVSHLR